MYSADYAPIVLGALFFAAAALYASVGHGGASGYLAVMGLVGFAPILMRPTALLMNVCVASIALFRFWHAARAQGGTQWQLFWPFALGSVPMAYLGGRIHLPNHWHAYVVGAVLIWSAWRLWLAARSNTHVHSSETQALPRLPLCIAIGGAIGLLAGLTGVGGGVFLSPLLILVGWAQVRTAAAPSAAFILLNSIAGLTGLYTHTPTLPSSLPIWLGAVILGGTLGAWLGARKLANSAMRRALAIVLLVAGIKMWLV